MSDIVLVGINHKTAPVELRECIAFSKEESVTAVQSLLLQPDLNEVILFSTCNRVEVLFVTDNKSRAIPTTKEFIADFNKIPLEEFENVLYVHEGDEGITGAGWDLPGPTRDERNACTCFVHGAFTSL